MLQMAEKSVRVIADGEIKVNAPEAGKKRAAEAEGLSSDDDDDDIVALQARNERARTEDSDIVFIV